MNPPPFVARNPALCAVTPAESIEFELIVPTPIPDVAMPPLKVPVPPTVNGPSKDPVPLAVRMVVERFLKLPVPPVKLPFAVSLCVVRLPYPSITNGEAP